MRWDDLFDGLAGELQGALDDEAARRAVDEERLRVGRLTVRERLVALAETSSAPISLQLSDGSLVAVRPKAFGSDWLSAELLAESGRARVCIVPTAGIASLVLTEEQLVVSLREPAASGPGDLSGRLGLAFALRDLGRRRRQCEFVVTTGTIVGTIDRVARDHVDVAVHERGVARRSRDVVAYRIIPLDDLRLVILADD
ncbi:hypothetical protein [Pseudoclavibacter sp. JSM 162008]|uniref:hypothetical protein n=1 Tax=Pseudoclavibacter sp. JSM 162008 TaxID=3229855 RepID=UPI003524C64D